MGKKYIVAKEDKFQQNIRKIHSRLSHGTVEAVATKSTHVLVLVEDAKNLSEFLSTFAYD